MYLLYRFRNPPTLEHEYATTVSQIRKDKKESKYFLCFLFVYITRIGNAKGNDHETDKNECLIDRHGISCTFKPTVFKSKSKKDENKVSGKEKYEKPNLLDSSG